MNINDELISFISSSPSPYHAVKTLEDMLVSEGYTRLYENRPWSIERGGKYYVIRNGSSVIALRIPEVACSGFMIMAAHSDAPTFRVKETAEVKGGGFTRLNVERYGGMICSTWLDRPLSLAGRAAVREDGGISVKTVDIDRDLLVIPNVAIHMERNINDGKSYNANVDMLPLMALENSRELDELVAESIGVDKKDIISKELSLYLRQKGFVWGSENEFISAPRLDDLQCVFSCARGFISAGKNSSINVLSIFDNEEVGSGTKQGADSEFLSAVLDRVCTSLGENRHTMLANTFMVSADNAHAVHPNHPEYADRSDRVRLNGGIVIKYSANQRYTTDTVSAAVFEEVCSMAGVPTQRFTNRADMLGGSTLGNISSSHVSVNTVDIGLPQLAMHSACETAGSCDTEYLIRAAKKFYELSFTQTGDRVELI